MALYAIVAPGGAILNMVVWDGVAPFNVAPNTAVLATGQPNAQIGGTFITGVWTAPSAPVPSQGQIFLNSPSSGATVPLPNPPQIPGGAPQTLYAILQPAAILATLTLQMPSGPVNDGTILVIFCTKAVTALTLTGATVNNAPTALVALAQVNIIWSQQYGVWFQL